jgi:hypothetical protein
MKIHLHTSASCQVASKNVLPHLTPRFAKPNLRGCLLNSECNVLSHNCSNKHSYSLLDTLDGISHFKMGSIVLSIVWFYFRWKVILIMFLQVQAFSEWKYSNFGNWLTNEWSFLVILILSLMFNNVSEIPLRPAFPSFICVNIFYGRLISRARMNF